MDTFWSGVASEVIQSGDPKLSLAIDMDSITTLFTKVVNTGGNDKAKLLPAQPAPVSKVSIVPQQRATNMGITFAKLKVSPSLFFAKQWPQCVYYNCCDYPMQ